MPALPLVVKPVHFFCFVFSPGTNLKEVTMEDQPGGVELMGPEEEETKLLDWTLSRFKTELKKDASSIKKLLFLKQIDLPPDALSAGNKEEFMYSIKSLLTDHYGVTFSDEELSVAANVFKGLKHDIIMQSLKYVRSHAGRAARELDLNLTTSEDLASFLGSENVTLDSVLAVHRIVYNTSRDASLIKEIAELVRKEKRIWYTKFVPVEQSFIYKIIGSQTMDNFKTKFQKGKTRKVSNRIYFSRDQASIAIFGRSAVMVKGSDLRAQNLGNWRRLCECDGEARDFVNENKVHTFCWDPPLKIQKKQRGQSSSSLGISDGEAVRALPPWRAHGPESNKHSQETQPGVLLAGIEATTGNREMSKLREVENARMDAKMREMDEDSESSRRPLDVNLSDSQSTLSHAHSFTIGGSTRGVSLCVGRGPMKAALPKKRSVEDSFPPPPAHVNGMDDHTEMSTMHGSWLDEVCPYAVAVDADGIVALTEITIRLFLSPLVCLQETKSHIKGMSDQMESMRKMLEDEKEGRRIVTDRLVSVEQLLQDLVNREATKSHDDQEAKRQKLEYNLGLTSGKRKPVDRRMNQRSHGSKSGGNGYHKESEVCNKTPLHSNREEKEVCFF